MHGVCVEDGTGPHQQGRAPARQVRHIRAKGHTDALLAGRYFELQRPVGLVSALDAHMRTQVAFNALANELGARRRAHHHLALRMWSNHIRGDPALNRADVERARAQHRVLAIVFAQQLGAATDQLVNGARTDIL